MTTDTPILLVDNNGPIATLTLNRPEKRNALSLELLGELDRALDAVASDSSSRVVILAANGPVFCSGHDLKEMTGRSEAEYHELFSLCSKVMQKFRQLPQPVIARVQGMATAAGCQLVAACDLAVAATEAKFATPGVKIGLFCTTPMVPLVRNVPAKVAMEMLLTGQPISAERAREAGLINQVAAAEELDAVIDGYCQSIAASSPAVIQIGKQAFYEQLPLSESAAYANATGVMTANALHADAQEGISAFLEKRPAEWTS
ncbi:enoyl-CoA hydratase [Calycomorphotria hydatis]|uniref:Enoyl-CoA hydratase domain-containing protein 3, mitochondrial n=1 Tax=Calycomorphotria hydatis TaxID=2528027 RepID=A0A517TEW5_9PLAN|nr:enoyl-CoA hydratase [Calycomorphotria hydatis]QDT66914.1 2,3-dehydroadipyl-CoA hydratase [Calycomorphotria hydatis]